MDKLSADDNIFNGNKLLNFSTDGDASRRQIFASMMEKDVTTFSFGVHLEGLSLFEVKVGTFGHTVNYDAKHLSKRLRNTLISMKKTIGIHDITHADLEELVSITEGVTNNTAKSLLNPMDRQNVPYATELSLRVQNFSEKADDIPLPFRLAQVAPGVKLLGVIAHGVLSLYAFLTLSVKGILESISSAAHVLLCLFKQFGSSFMPSQLYNDLMETFKDICVCAAKYKTWKPGEPFLVVSLGTDSLENYFCVLRSLHNNGMMDALEIINRSQWIHTVEDILEKHQDWKANHYGPKRLKVALDRSRQINGTLIIYS